jgi:ubiquinone/menaquinone biosynthesis C-methylase UbiE
VNTNEVLNQKTKERYSLYAQFYPLLALLAYYVIWRGNIFKHIQFFKNLITEKSNVLDIATGDGSLTATALDPEKNANVESLVCLDISPDMLNKAKKKLKSARCKFVLGDVGKMPFADGQFSVISCFGGLNSFPDVPLALREINRVLSPHGKLRGSVLLLPQSPWRQRRIHQWIEEGYQTQTITTDKLSKWISEARFELSVQTHIGDVVLFELKKSKDYL